MNILKAPNGFSLTVLCLISICFLTVSFALCSFATPVYVPFNDPEGDIQVTNKTSGGFNWIVTGTSGTVHYVSVGKYDISLAAVNVEDEDQNSSTQQIVNDSIPNSSAGMEWEEIGAGLLTESTGSSAKWDAGTSPGGGTITLKLNDAGNYAEDGNFMPVDTYAIQVMHHDRETSQDIGDAPACPPEHFGRGDEYRVHVEVVGMPNLSLYLETVREDEDSTVWQQDGQVINSLPFDAGLWDVQANNTFGPDRVAICFNTEITNTVITADIPIKLVSAGDVCVISRATFTISAAGPNSLLTARTQIGN